MYHRTKPSVPSELLLSLNIKTRLYSDDDLSILLESAGWTREASFSDIISLKEANEDSRELVVVGRKL